MNDNDETKQGGGQLWAVISVVETSTVHAYPITHKRGTHDECQRWADSRERDGFSYLKVIPHNQIGNYDY